MKGLNSDKQEYYNALQKKFDSMLNQNMGDHNKTNMVNNDNS